MPEQPGVGASVEVKNVFASWIGGARDFQREFYKAAGVRANPQIVFEHPGRDTFPTSTYICDEAGMVVYCAGTSGFNGDISLLYGWNLQKRVQGSHFANGDQCRAFNDLVIAGKVDPCLTEPVFQFGQIGLAHQLLYENRGPGGNMVALVGARERGLGRSK
jgi:crotonyl-CoA carboxylase/reductase